MNWKTTLCGVLLTGATTLGCTAANKDVKSPEGRLGPKVEYNGWDSFTIRAKNPDGTVELEYYADSGTVELFLSSKKKVHIASYNYDNDGAIDLIQHEDNGYCWRNPMYDYMPKCSEEQLEEASNVMDKYKKELGFGKILEGFKKHEKQADFLEGVK